MTHLSLPQICASRSGMLPSPIISPSSTLPRVPACGDWRLLQAVPLRREHPPHIPHRGSPCIVQAAHGGDVGHVQERLCLPLRQPVPWQCRRSNFRAFEHTFRLSCKHVCDVEEPETSTPMGSGSRHFPAGARRRNSSSKFTRKVRCVMGFGSAVPSAFRTTAARLPSGDMSKARTGGEPRSSTRWGDH